MARRTLTYGVLPSRRDFDIAMGDQRFRIQLGASDSRAADGTSIGDGSYGPDELWKGLGQLVRKFERGSEPAGDLAASILSTLGFEWV